MAEDDTVVFSFRLGSELLVVTAEDADTILYTAAKTRLQERNLEDVLAAFRYNCGADDNVPTADIMLSKQQFDAAIRQLVPAKWVEELDKELLSHVLATLFHAYDMVADGDEYVGLAEVLCGLSLLCGGSKSAKLAFAFDLFDSDGDGLLSPSKTATYLSSFMTALCALTSQGAAMAPEDLIGSIDNAAFGAVQALVGSMRENGANVLNASTSRGLISFEDIGDWYNTGGFELIPWLELLDLKKWFIALPGGANEVVNGDDEYEYDYADESESGSPSPKAVRGGASAQIYPSRGGMGRPLEPPLPPPPAASKKAESKRSPASLQQKFSEMKVFPPVVPPGVQSTTTANDKNVRGADEDVLFQFELGWTNSGTLLTLTKGDVDAVLRLAFRSGLANMDARRVSAQFMRAAEGNVLQKRGFYDVVRKLVPGPRLTAKEKEEFSALLSIIFYTLDHKGPASKDTVNAAELAAGFSLFCAGNKSEKLASGFSLLNDTADGLLDRKGLWRLIRSVLCVLLGISSGSGQLSAQELNEMIDIAAVWTSVKIFEGCAVQASGGISFDDLANWYTAGGYRDAPWLELLDLSKWKKVQSQTAQASATRAPTAVSAQRVVAARAVSDKQFTANGYSGDEYSGSEYESDDYEGQKAEHQREPVQSEDEEIYEEDSDAEDSDEEPVLTFSLGPSQRLPITKDDVEFVQRVVLGTRLAVRDPAEILQLMRDTALSPDTMTKKEFNDCLRQLVPERWLTEQDKKLLSFALSNIFFAYDAAEAHVVRLRDLVCGLCFLCRGNKSTKLAFCFSLFDEEGDGTGSLTPVEMQQYFSSLLTVLCACMAKMLEEKNNYQMWKVVKSATSAAVSALFYDPDSSCKGKDSVTFEEFGTWYNRGGFKVVPWLELLDLTKWVPGVQAMLDEHGLLGKEDDVGDDEEEENDQEATAKARFSFQVSESANSVPLVLGAEDVEAVLDLTKGSGLGFMEPAQVCGTILAASSNGMIEKSAFDTCMQKLLPSSQLGVKQKSAYSVLLSCVFFAFDRDNACCVDAIELAAGFSLLCSGNKSSKLAFAFQLFDQNEELVLTRRGLWRYMRSFLAVLMGLSEASASLSAEELTRAVDDGAVWTSATIFAEADTAAQESNTLSFDQFAAWYTDGGFRTSPWLELLDLNKWEPAVGGGE